MKQGKIIIGCRLDSKELEKDLKKSEKDLEKYEKEAEKLTEAKAKIDVDVSNAEKKIDNLNEKIEQAYQKMQREKVKLSEIPSWKRDTEEYQKQLESLEKAKNKYNDLTTKQIELNSKLNLQVQKQAEINSKIESNAVSQSMLNDKIQETSQKLKQVKGFGNIKNRIEDVNKGLTQTIKKVAKWGIALFGIRTAYNAIRGAMGVLTQHNDELASKIESMKLIVATAFEPVINWIINLMSRLLSYVNEISKAWFHVDLFARASSKSISKSAKETKKMVAGFDEMNIASDTSGTSSTGGQFIAPEQGEVPEWLKWIIDHKDEILAVITGVATGLGLWYLKFSGIKALGFGVVLAGIVYTIEKLMKYLKDPTWENFGGVITGIGISIVGLGIAFGSLPAIIIGTIVIIVGVLAKNWKKIKAGLDKAYEWVGKLTNILIDWLVSKFGGLGVLLAAPLGGVLGLIQGVIDTIKTLLGGLFKSVKGIFDGIINIFKGNFKSGIKQVMKGIVNLIITMLNTLISALNAIFSPIRALIIAAGKVVGKKWTMESVKIPKIKMLSKGGIINQPGRGVPIGYGQAIGGENRAEGVIPLTDSQQMALIGEAIGKYVNINATIPVYVSNRQIAREQRKINANNDFAFNR